MTLGPDVQRVGTRLRELRLQSGLTQSQLATRAGTSRQLVGAVEAGRHLPRLDAGVGLATALGVSAEELLRPGPNPVVGVVSPPPGEGAAVRLGRVGDQWVCARPPVSGESWTPADGLVGRDGVELLPEARPGTVVVGCEPGIGLAERLLAQRGGPPMLAVPASTAAGLDALARRCAHAAVVHGPADALPGSPVPVRRQRLARWRVGLVGPPGAAEGWWHDALTGRVRVAQREPGAVVQAALERAVTQAGGELPVGPVVTGHVEAAQRARLDGLVALSIEPVAQAAGLAFHPLEAHVVQLWVAAEWAHEPGIEAVQDELASPAFHRRLAAIGGYDLQTCGTMV